MDQTYRIIILNYVILCDILHWIFSKGKYLRENGKKITFLLFWGKVKNR